MKADIRSLRKLLWHFRSGGPQQVRTWLAREAFEAGHRKLDTVRGAEGVWVGRGKNRRLKFRSSTVAPPRAGSMAAVRGCCGARRLFGAGLRYGMGLHTVVATSWLEQLSDSPVDLLLVESAWNGNRGNGPGR